MCESDPSSCFTLGDMFGICLGQICGYCSDLQNPISKQVQDVCVPYMNPLERHSKSNVKNQYKTYENIDIGTSIPYLYEYQHEPI